MVELNRIVVFAEIEGAKTGLYELAKFRRQYDLSDYYLLHVTEAHFLSETGAVEQALQSYSKALSLTENKSIRRFLERRIEELKVKHH